MMTCNETPVIWHRSTTSLKSNSITLNMQQDLVYLKTARLIKQTKNVIWLSDYLSKE